MRLLVSALKRSGAEDVAVEDGKHHMLFFSIRGSKATPIVISKTPSDRNAGAKVAADIRREFKRLDLQPPTTTSIVGLFGWVVTGGFVGNLAGLTAKGKAALSPIGGQSIWDLLDEWERA
jgi:hypothetical protein